MGASLAQERQTAPHSVHETVDSQPPVYHMKGPERLDLCSLEIITSPSVLPRNGNVAVNNVLDIIRKKPVTLALGQPTCLGS